MLTRPQVQRYAADSGLRDIMIAEKEVVLTFLLQLLSERGILRRVAFKGGTCLRKMFLGSQGRFSTDLDFTGIEDHDHEEVILDMMQAFEQPFHGIQFSIPDESYYETQDGLSWGVNPVYSHDWNTSGVSEVKLQISRRETPTLPTEYLPQLEQSYFRQMPFTPAEIMCLALPEILAEKIRACYQRNKARDIYDLGMFATRPLDHALIRRLVVLKLWQARDTFDPGRLIQTGLAWARWTQKFYKTFGRRIVRCSGLHLPLWPAGVEGIVRPQLLPPVSKAGELINVLTNMVEAGIDTRVTA